jgi:SOS-response transcriptional repressor LexA
MQHDEQDMEFVAEGNDVRGVSVHAGFPNPAADFRGASALSLDKLLIAHPSSSYFFRVQGDSWTSQGIFDGDIALIDRALDPQPSDLVICWHDQGFNIVQLSQVAEGDEPWGVIRSIIHEYRKKDL